MLRSLIILLLFIPFLCRALDITEKMFLAYELVLDHTDEDKRSAIDTLRQVCIAWRDRIDLKQNNLFTKFPQLTSFKGLASSLVFNSHNEWCGVGKYKAVDTLVFGTQGNWCATPIKEKHNIAPWHTKPTIISTHFHRKTAFFIPDCYIIPQDLELHIFCITPEMRACKKTYPRCFRTCDPIVIDGGKTPRLTQYTPYLKQHDKRFKNFFLLRPFLTNAYTGEDCFCVADKPSHACKTNYDAIVCAAQEEELDESAKQKVISIYLSHHIFSRCNDRSFDDFQYAVTLNSKNSIFFKPKKDGGRDKEWFKLLPSTNASTANTWEEAITAVQKQAAEWQCKNNFVYQCNFDEASTAVSIINVNTYPTVAHNLLFPYPHCNMRDIFFKSACAYIYLSNTTKAYLITWPHNFIKKRENSCYSDKTNKKWHELMQYAVQRADIQQIGDGTELINRLLETVNKDEMHAYALPSPELIIDWQSIEFVSNIKIKNDGNHGNSLNHTEMAQLIQLPVLYAKHLKDQVIDISQCQKKSWNLFSFVCAPFLDYELMAEAFKTNYQCRDWFFSDYVYAVAAACALWPWQTPPTVRTIGFGAIVRYISSGLSTRIINELPHREMSSRQRTFFKTDAYILPLSAIFSSYGCSVLLNSSPYLGILSPIVWGFFDGLCILNSDAGRYVSCAYTSFWSSRWAQLYRWYHKKS